MKRGIIFIGLFILLVSIFSVSAAVAHMDDIILKISSDTNAHGQKYTGLTALGSPTYPVNIKYSEIFGDFYSGGSPYTCTANNVILRLSADTNAHAQQPYYLGGAVYLTSICYGNLACRYVPGGSCVGGEKCVVTLSSETNAHLAKCDGSAPYENKICCAPAAPPVVACDGYTTRETCPVGCSWTPPGSVNDSLVGGSGGCCPKERPIWSGVSCGEGADRICHIPFTLEITNALRTGGVSAAIDIINQQPENNVDSIYYSEGPLDKNNKEYCSQVSKEINWGLWYPSITY